MLIPFTSNIIPHPLRRPTISYDARLIRWREAGRGRTANQGKHAPLRGSRPGTSPRARSPRTSRAGNRGGRNASTPRSREVASTRRRTFRHSALSCPQTTDTSRTGRRGCSGMSAPAPQQAEERSSLLRLSQQLAQTRELRLHRNRIAIRSITKIHIALHEFLQKLDV